MSRKRNLDLLRAENPLMAFRPDNRRPILEPRVDLFPENLARTDQFGPQPQTIDFSRLDSEGQFKLAKNSFFRHTAFRFEEDEIVFHVQHWAK
jgi:hypothetical protein